MWKSCYDCHSNNTKYTWYNKVQPVAWFLEDHVKEGKAELNFNEWDSWSNCRKKSKLKSIIIHGDTKLSKKEITQWLTQLRDSI